ncbi:MAG: chemotaxis protein CheR [Oligoflexia bacterium]|nr:MAG: chemotaxis protein CheR [Oligoflexia bacterium]
MSAAPELFTDMQSDRKGFQLLSDYLRNAAGISMPLNEKNLCLMASRLGKVMRNHNLDSYAELYKRMQMGDMKVRDEFIMALTTNTTHFFRESIHFDTLTRYLPSLCQLNPKDNEFRLWCAASSTGQEPYTLAMTCHNYFEYQPQMNCKILATDIDLKVLSTAAHGCYQHNEVANIDSATLKKYFHRVHSVKGDRYQVNTNISDLVRFSRLNLLDPQFPFKKKFHVIFCRNVFIYFEKDTVAQIISKMADVLYPGGLLFLGHAESGIMRSPVFKNVEHAVYRRV